MASNHVDLHDKTDRWELLVGWDTSGEVLKALACDPTSRALFVGTYVWNTSTLAWEKMVQPNFQNTGDIYVAVDDVEQYILDTLAHYKLDDFDTSNDPTFYLGYQDKDGNYFIKRINTSTGAVDYTKGASGYSTAWTNRASESYSDFASTF